MKKRPELLSPAGSFESMIAAINAGCDAVYVGGKQFSARAYASNFDTEELIQAIHYCHLRGVKIYLTVNTLFKENELDDLLMYIHEVYQAGIDALILQDFGTAMLIKDIFKELEIHASTQMTIHNLKGVNYLKEAGFSRVVLSRESDLDEIKYIINNTDTEIECFVHGALCYSYSGQCLMSSILGGRSGNRGRCAGTCRLPYTLMEDSRKLNHQSGKYLLSPKDIATIDLIPELIEAGIHSFKIEGRMKSPEYVASVTAVYRKYIDQYLTNPTDYNVDKKDKELLLEIYNRGGFSKGYYKDKNRQIMSMNKPNNQGAYIGKVIQVNKKNKTIQIGLDKKVNKGDKLEIWTGSEPQPSVNIKNTSDNPVITLKEYSRDVQPGNKVYRTKNKQTYDDIRDGIINKAKKKKVPCRLMVTKNKPITLELEFHDMLITEIGAEVQKAKNQSLSHERIIKQLKKTGDYPFELDMIDTIIEEDVFIPISEINKIRRNALENLSRKIVASYKNKPIPNIPSTAVHSKKNSVEQDVYVLIRTLDQLKVLMKFDVTGVYIESEFLSLEELNQITQLCTRNKIRAYIALPRILTKAINARFLDKYTKIKELDFDGYLIRTYGEMELVGDTNKEVIMDYNMNIINNKTIEAWEHRGTSRITLSPELHQREIKQLNTNDAEMLIYGYLPLMVSKQCVVNNATKNNNICYNNKKYYLKDRYGKAFYVDRRCNNCLNVIYNSSPLLLLDQMDKLKEQSIRHLRLEFTTETNDQIISIMTLTMDILNGKKISTDNILKVLGIKEFNRGHFMRGIE